MPRTATSSRKPRNVAAGNEPEDITAGLAPLSANQIKLQTDDRSFSRGRGYRNGGRIFHPVRRGNTIYARCHGSTGGPYRIEATLAPADQPTAMNPVAAACDCPRGGFCKHIVAMLLTWIERPDSFVVQPTVAELLAGKSREELASMVEQIITAVPELDIMLDLPDPATAPLSDAPVDERTIRKQIATALPEEGEDWDSRYENAPYYDEYGEGAYGFGGIDTAIMTRLTALGESYARANQWRNALSVYATIAEEVAPRLEEIQEFLGESFYEYDGEDELGPVLTQCDDALAAILDAQANLPEAERLTAEERTRLIEAIFAIWEADIEAGGLELSEAGPIAIGRFASTEERHAVGEWLRRWLTPQTQQSSSTQAWNTRSVIWFLGLLGPDGGLSDDQILEEYRNAELWSDAADLLLRTGRTDEAISLAARHLTQGTALTQFASALVASGDSTRTKQAIALIDDCLWEREGKNPRDDQILSAWLEHHLTTLGRPDEALKLAHRRFQQLPSRTTFDAVREIATLPERTGEPWAELRPSMLTALSQRNDWPALVAIHLDAGEMPEALAAFKHLKAAGSYAYDWSHLAEHVAAAVSPTLPDEAILIYRALADQKIQGRNRDSYQIAAHFLAEARSLLLAGGRQDDWLASITRLRQQHKTLRALQDELNKRGLE